jgi:hypothetical protein
LARVKFTDEFVNDGLNFYPYVQEESSAAGLRYENLAFDYYDDPDDGWIIWITNSVIDPYYDVCLSQDDFDKFIEKKYGSIRLAQQTIKFYRNNYYQDDRIISESTFNALTAKVKKYWTPSVNYDNMIIGYERLKDDTILSTNKILTIELTLQDETKPFDVNEKVIQNSASGFVTFSNTTFISIQHIEGQFVANSSTSPYAPTPILGETSGANGSPASTEAVKIIAENADDVEEVYFSPVTVYDYENELNEKKKTINLLDRRYVPIVQSKFVELMRE